jgi:putative restriction endonuclease
VNSFLFSSKELILSMSSYELIKYFTKRDLIEANDAAIREKRSQTMRSEYLNNLPENLLYPVFRDYYHASDEVRLDIILNYEGNHALLDVSELRFNALPTAKRYEDGTVEYESNEEIELKRPYPNRREWQETVVRKPVRKQAKFRKIVLEAYGSQCAVCSVNNPKLLRAAHIIPVVDGGDDSINNGICLCVNHEIGFDRGIFIITTEIQVVVNSENDLGVKYLKIRLPSKKEYYPSVDNLAKRLKILNISDKQTPEI